MLVISLTDVVVKPFTAAVPNEPECKNMCALGVLLPSTEYSQMIIFSRTISTRLEGGASLHTPYLTMGHIQTLQHLTLLPLLYF